MSREAVIVIGEGTVTALAGGPLSIADMGDRTTKRASYLEFNSGTNEWEVLSLDARDPLYSHPDYDVALQWEIDHFNRLLSVVG
jgi:hypothetical protein